MITHEYIVEWEEEATIGLDHTYEDYVTESDLRAEHGLPMRGSWNRPDGFVDSVWEIKGNTSIKAIWVPSKEPFQMQTLEIRKSKNCKDDIGFYQIIKNTLSVAAFGIRED